MLTANKNICVEILFLDNDVIFAYDSILWIICKRFPIFILFSKEILDSYKDILLQWKCLKFL